MKLFQLGNNGGSLRGIFCLHYKKSPLDYPEDGGKLLQNDSNCSSVYIAHML